MAKFDPDEALTRVIKSIKDDLGVIDTTIEELLNEAISKKGIAAGTKIHDVTPPLTKLLSTKQKNIDQLLKIISSQKKTIDPEEEVQLDLETMYSEFEHD